MNYSTLNAAGDKEKLISLHGSLGIPVCDVSLVILLYNVVCLTTNRRISE